MVSKMESDFLTNGNIPGKLPHDFTDNVISAMVCQHVQSSVFAILPNFLAQYKGNRKQTMRNPFLCWFVLCLALVSQALVPTAAAAATYRGNIRSGVYHNSSCRYFACKNCTAVFSSREDAIRAGFRPCKICGG